MMRLPFTKMQAQGNDFVILDGRTSELPDLGEDFVRDISERRYGVGCDQLLVLLPHASADAALRIFNNDGSEAANCGNGLRCVGDLLMRQSGKAKATIALADRVVRAERSDDAIRVEMGAASIGNESEAHVDVRIGNRHRVVFEATEDFPADCNIEIVTGRIADHAYIDIIELGAGRTPACGSGACATAAAIWHREGHNRPQTIVMPGGEVSVSGDMNNLVLAGAVAPVYEGVYTCKT